MKTKKSFVSQLLADIKTAVKLTGAARKARKIGGGGSIQMETIWTLPCVVIAPAYLNTIEGCQTWRLGRDAYQAVEAVYDGLPYETQRALELSPNKSGEWAARARFWQECLKPVLPQEMYHRVMLRFIRWYAYCLRERILTP